MAFKLNYLLLNLVVILLAAPPAIAIPTYYTDRTFFLDSVKKTITDDYSSYTTTPGTPVNLTDAEMSSVFGETRYESTSFSNLNLVGDIYAYGDGSNYCAGCNGNFKLFFDDTSVTKHGGVYGVGLDIVFHTSRHSSLGDVIPGDRVVDGTILVEFTDGLVETISVPADIGFFEPEVFFLGITDVRGIRSLTIGTESLPLRHSWIIDNLTIAKKVPEPPIILLLSSGIIGLIGVARRKKS